MGIDARYWDALGKRVVKGNCGSFEGCGDVFIGDVAAFVMVIVESREERFRGCPVMS